MPFLPDERSTNKLLKHLAIDLFEQLEPAELRKFGWFQYRDHDHLGTLVATEFAANAFVYLSFDASGSWRRNPKVVTAVLSFMGRYHERRPQAQDLVELKRLIEVRPATRRRCRNGSCMFSRLTRRPTELSYRKIFPRNSFSAGRHVSQPWAPGKGTN